jgi:hypothetical protein
LEYGLVAPGILTHFRTTTSFDFNQLARVSSELREADGSAVLYVFIPVYVETGAAVNERLPAPRLFFDRVKVVEAFKLFDDVFECSIMSLTAG